ncbi:MAG: hypothetical protein GXP17_11690 [Gammaproteobacteria bacterium]|nr:hypothetical protein [Gammaproteobacteria bacterium]
MSRTRKYSIGPICVVAASLSLPLTTAMAGEIGDVQWHGYLTSAMLISSDGTYSGDVTDAGSGNDTRMGLNVSTQVDESLSFAAQIKAKGTNDFNLEVDWAFASYDVSENIILRFGKIKYPVGIYNGYVDVGYTYPWIRPPEVFYNQDRLGPNLIRVAYQGFGAEYKTFVGNTELGFHLFGGAVDVLVGRVNKLTGTKFSVNMEDEIRFEISAITGEMEIDGQLKNAGVKALVDGKRHTTYTAGLIVDLSHFVLSSEYASATVGSGSVKQLDMTSQYVMMGYRFGTYMPHITWEKWDVDSGRGQKSIGIGLRKELTTNSALKFEVRKITPSTTANLSIPPGSNIPAPGTGYGLFSSDDVKDGKDVTLVGIAIEMVF